MTYQLACYMYMQDCLIVFILRVYCTCTSMGLYLPFLRLVKMCGTLNQLLFPVTFIFIEAQIIPDTMLPDTRLCISSLRSGHSQRCTAWKLCHIAPLLYTGFKHSSPYAQDMQTNKWPSILSWSQRAPDGTERLKVNTMMFHPTNWLVLLMDFVLLRVTGSCLSLVKSLY